MTSAVSSRTGGKSRQQQGIGTDLKKSATATGLWLICRENARPPRTPIPQSGRWDCQGGRGHQVIRNQPSHNTSWTTDRMNTVLGMYTTRKHPYFTRTSTTNG